MQLAVKAKDNVQGIYISHAMKYFMEQNLRFELVLGRLAVLKTAKLNLLLEEFFCNCLYCC